MLSIIHGYTFYQWLHYTHHNCTHYDIPYCTHIEGTWSM